MPARKSPPPKEQALQARKDNNKSGQGKASLEKGPDIVGMSRGICRTHILEKYWELANLDPEATKGTITGQLKALDSLCQKLDIVPPEKARPLDKLDSDSKIYRSSWMDSGNTTEPLDDE